MATFPHHERLRLVNFTAFADASFEWSPGINAIIGANGTGKTHLLKVLYAVQHACAQGWRGHSEYLESVFTEVFQVPQTAGMAVISVLIRQQSSPSAIGFGEGNWSGQHWEFGVVELDSSFPYRLMPNGTYPPMTRTVFIPVADMMGHTKRFGSTYDQYRIDFDQTYRDIVSALLSPPLRDQAQVADALKPLADVLGGEVEEEGERFYLRTAHGRQPMPLVAEGLRKIATLYTLIKNGYLRPGDTLFWDEPETNLNPTLMDEVIAALLSLARSGVQIFLTTHSYFILSELDLQAKRDDAVRFFSLYTDEDKDGTQVETANVFTELQHNAIMEQANSVYDRQLTRATGRARKK